MFQIRSTGASVSSSSIYSAANIEACQAAGVQMSNAAELEAGWIKSGVVPTVFPPALPETASSHILFACGLLQKYQMVVHGIKRKLER